MTYKYGNFSLIILYTNYTLVHLILMEQKQLAKILKERGIKQTWIAKQLKVSKQLVNQWVNGRANIQDSHQIELRKLLLS